LATCIYCPRRQTGRHTYKTMADDSSANNDVEDKIVQEEYRVWKKNTPFLYDLVMTHALDWPSLTVQWMTDQKSVPGDSGVNIHKMVLGTHTSNGEPNYLMVAEVSLPSADSEIDARKYDDDKVSSTIACLSACLLARSIALWGMLYCDYIDTHETTYLINKLIN